MMNRFEVGIKPFGKMDEVQFYRHYVQGTSNLACRRNAGTTSNDGSNEGPATPRSLAYAANKSPLNQVWGKMAQVSLSTHQTGQAMHHSFIHSFMPLVVMNRCTQAIQSVGDGLPRITWHMLMSLQTWCLFIGIAWQTALVTFHNLIWLLKEWYDDIFISIHYKQSSLRSFQRRQYNV
jgi:hypothetical protein